MDKYEKMIDWVAGTAMTREARIERIANEVLRKADLFDGKPEYTKMDDLQSKYIYDPEHKKSKTEAQRSLGTNQPIHETPKGWAEGPEQLDLFKHAPATSNENTDLFGNPIPAEQAVLPLKQEPIVEPTKPEVKPDLKGQEVMPIEPFIPPVAEPPIIEKKTPAIQTPVTTTPPAVTTNTPPQSVTPPVGAKQKKEDPNAMKNAVKLISRKFGASKALESVPHHMLKSIGNNITKFDEKGIDSLVMSVNSPDNKNLSVVIPHNATPINDIDAGMQTLHAVGSAWAVSSGLASNPDFQQEANKAWTKDMDNFVSKFTDMPIPGEEEKTLSPANWIAKGYSNPRTKGAFYKMFARNIPQSGEKAALMVRATIGAMKVASNGEYGFGVPEQIDDGMETRVANMAGYVAQGLANDNGFFKKNMPLTSKLFDSMIHKA